MTPGLLWLTGQSWVSQAARWNKGPMSCSETVRENTSMSDRSGRAVRFSGDSARGDVRAPTRQGKGARESEKASEGYSAALCHSSLELSSSMPQYGTPSPSPCATRSSQAVACRCRLLARVSNVGADDWIPWDVKQSSRAESTCTDNKRARTDLSVVGVETVHGPRHRIKGALLTVVLLPRACQQGPVSARPQTVVKVRKLMTVERRKG